MCGVLLPLCSPMSDRLFRLACLAALTLPLFACSATPPNQVALSVPGQEVEGELSAQLEELATGIAACWEETSDTDFTYVLSVTEGEAESSIWVGAAEGGTEATRPDDASDLPESVVSCARPQLDAGLSALGDGEYVLVGVVERSLTPIEKGLIVAVDLAWGPPLLFLLVIGGLLLTIYSRFLPFRAVGHAVHVLRGKYDDPDDPGEISHFAALATALSSTIGLGNIGGVAIAISQGGPGAVFWMWVAALLGMTTKFFTCTLAVMYRRPDETGIAQGGPMYYIEQGLGPRWRWMAMFFSVCGMIGCLAIFQTNQLAEIMGEAASVPGWVTGLVCTMLVSVVLLGGLKRIALVASKLVPAMCALYLVMVIIIVGMHASEIPAMFSMIVSHAFNGGAVVGGAEGVAFWVVFQTGIKRAAFSNEAGVGTAPMAHGAAKTAEPVREGLVAMIGPFIDTIIVCSLTAFAIIATDVWSTDSVRGVGMTLLAFESALGAFGKYGLLLVVSLFGATTMFGYSYYGRKCFSYLFGANRVRIYDAFYLFMLFIGAVWAADVVVNLLDTSFALMAFPNMLATLLLAPRVIKETRAYFGRMDALKSEGDAVTP